MPEDQRQYAYRLTRPGSEDAHVLADGVASIIGRSAEADICIANPTLSRLHADIHAVDGRLRVRDRASSNGTFINGRRIDEHVAVDGDVLAFGSLDFAVSIQPVTSGSTRDAAEANTDVMIVRERAVHQHTGVLTAAVEGTTVMASAAPAHELTQRKLSLLLEVSTALSGVASTDTLLDQIADYVFQIMNVDRLSILICDGDALVTRVARDRQGGETARVVPRSIAQRVVADRVAILSANAPQDDRFAGESIVMQSVRSAMCAPLIGREGIVLGVLYIDNLSATNSFTDDDLAFLIAFCGIAAVAIENGRYAERIRREALARGNFERFFTPALAARIAGSDEGIQLGGEKRRVVVLFSDIRGFTPLSEHLAPEEVAALLSEYFTAMVECVFRHGGTLDKFVGDAIMAQWGAPLSSGNDVDRAVYAAFDMLAALDTLNRQWKAEGRTPFNIGIGLNAGDVFAGYVGSERRLEYTVLGDAVNVASRLCSAAAGGEILVTEALMSELTATTTAVERTNMQLKGKTQAVRVFALQPA